MRKHGGTPSRRDKHVTLAAISPPGVARGRFVGGQQSGLAGCKPPPLFTRGASSCSSQGRRQGEPWGASRRPSAPTYLRTCRYSKKSGMSQLLETPPVALCFTLVRTCLPANRFHSWWKEFHEGSLGYTTPLDPQVEVSCPYQVMKLQYLKENIAKLKQSCNKVAISHIRG